jgi:hypothetical protein
MVPEFVFQFFFENFKGLFAKHTLSLGAELIRPEAQAQSS